MKMLWPIDLAVFYPHPGTALPAWKVVAAGMLLAALTVLALARLRKTPWLAVAGAGISSTLLPVIGLVQVGMQGSADRYMYIPMVGPSLILAWAALRSPGGGRSGGDRPFGRLGRRGGRLCHRPHSCPLARTQAATWRDDVTLFSHAIAVTPPNAVAEKALASTLRKLRQARGGSCPSGGGGPDHADLATAHSELAAPDRPRGARARADHCLKALSLWPEHPGALNNLGLIRLRQGRAEEGLDLVTRSLAANPNQGPAHVNLALALMQKGRLEDAVAHLRTAIGLDRTTSTRTTTSASPSPPGKDRGSRRGSGRGVADAIRGCGRARNLEALTRSRTAQPPP